MNRIQALPEVDNLAGVAEDLLPLLQDGSNQDIAGEFPASVKRYATDIESAIANLQEAAEDCAPGARQQFVAFAGETAVGLSVVRFANATQLPPEIDPSWPNISYFVCNPYRNQGIAKLALVSCMDSVKSEFGGTAWTIVKKTNDPSNAVVSNFAIIIGETETNFIYKLT